MKLGLCTILAAVLAAAGGQQAVDRARLSAKFLQPLDDKVATSADDERALRLQSDSGREAQAIDLSPERLDWLFVRGAGNQSNYDAVTAPRREPPDGPLLITLARNDATLVGLDLATRVEPASGSELAKYLTEHTVLERGKAPLDALVPSRQYRVRRIESMKAILRNTPGPESRTRAAPSATVQSKSGQPAEIRLLADPTATPLDCDIPLRVYAGNASRPGARVLVRSAVENTLQSLVTDKVGTAYFRLNAPGAWSIEFNHAEPLPDDPEADWVIYTATLTFEAAQAGRGS